MDEAAQVFAKVQVLLAEHATLRAELVARIGHVYQLIGPGVTVLVLLFVTLNPFKLKFLGKIATRAEERRSKILFFTMLAALTAVFAVAVTSYEIDKTRIAERLREIERDVNDRMKEDLLVWESLWGDAAAGPWRWSRPLPRSELATAPPVRTYRGKEIEK